MTCVPTVLARYCSTGFSSEEWRQLADDDWVTLSGISLLLTAIIGLGMVGMLVVVAILAFG